MAYEKWDLRYTIYERVEGRRELLGMDAYL
jgi:hypothetical protein